MRKQIKQAETVVVKVGTSTLTYETGKLNLRRLEHLVRVISDINNSGKRIVLVSSGAVGVGVSKLGLSAHPDDLKEKQAAAAVGQCELMSIYDRLFSEYNTVVAQLLVTTDVIDNAEKMENVINTFAVLLNRKIIPIVNENDSVSTEELKFGDNDTLSAIVAHMVSAQALVILSDIDGFYDMDPRGNPKARVIPHVSKITREIKEMAFGAGARGVGGMQTKLAAAEYANEKNIHVVIANGRSPDILYNILDGEEIGTVFTGGESSWTDL